MNNSKSAVGWILTKFDIQKIYYIHYFFRKLNRFSFHHQTLTPYDILFFEMISFNSRLPTDPQDIVCIYIWHLRFWKSDSGKISTCAWISWYVDSWFSISHPHWNNLGVLNSPDFVFLHFVCYISIHIG